MFLKIPGRKTNAFRKMRRKTDFAEIYWETGSNYEYIRWMLKVVIVPCLHSSLLNWGGSSRLKSPGHHLHTNRKPCQNTDKAFFLLAWMTIWMPLRPTIISTIQTPSLPSFKGFFFFSESCVATQHFVWSALETVIQCVCGGLRSVLLTEEREDSLASQRCLACFFPDCN